jgi:UDP-N-acetylmuramoylalanine--D-glutamate ligase
MKLILGMGITGLSVARFFANNNEIFRIADSRKEPSLLKTFQKENLLDDCYMGEWSESLLEDIDEVIISPGIAQSETIVQWIREKKIVLKSDIELFGRNSNAPIIGITGSNGKSTVTQLLGEMALASNLNAVICGNIGSPVMESIIDNADLYIVELSSYQLDYTSELDLFAGVITNISPDHLDRYDNYEAYIASKLSIYSYSQYAIANLDDSILSKSNADSYFAIENYGSDCDFYAKKKDKLFEVFYKGELIFNSQDLLVVGKHNIENLLAALALGNQFGLSIESMINAAKKFKGLTHRLEFVTRIDEVDYYNDSKSTNAISTITAINALAERYNTITLIAGGIAKNEDYSQMFSLINQKVNTIVLIGESKDFFAQSINGCSVIIEESLEGAIASAKKHILKGAVLLSPGCASFDMFSDFSERGEVFKQSILQQDNG